jgi:hypothetical protein
VSWNPKFYCEANFRIDQKSVFNLSAFSSASVKRFLIKLNQTEKKQLKLVIAEKSLHFQLAELDKKNAFNNISG